MQSIGLRSARTLDGKSYGRGGIFLNNERGLEIPRGKLELEEPVRATGEQRGERLHCRPGWGA